LNVNDNVNIVNVKSTTNTTGIGNSGFNGTFKVTAISNDKEFQYSTTDTDGNNTYNRKILQMILQQEQLIYQDSKEMIYKLTSTFIEVKL
jgi:hypothetical protein